MNIIDNYEILNLIYKTILYIVLPIVVSMLVTSFISGFLQSIITIYDEAISYSLKVIVLSLVLFFIYPNIQEILTELMRVALK
ncbi:MAG: flagellar biosynthetic protein FliQ [Bdellovibrionota bacterium]|nr:flagellar biosynthetic protein FliQ [Pseudomonadota bacterium]MDY6091387.1 flagellar biosynthetic protein FliQ [Bdellovibrionota bacterium]